MLRVGRLFVLVARGLQEELGRGADSLGVAERRRGLAVLLGFELLELADDLFVLLYLFLVLGFLFSFLASGRACLASLRLCSLAYLTASLLRSLPSLPCSISLTSLRRTTACTSTACLSSTVVLLLGGRRRLALGPCSLLSASHTFREA